jgi:hypothetical protein
MDETYKPYVEKLLAGGMKTAEDVAKFVETQTPELGREIIMWGAVSELVAPLTAFLAILSTIFLHIKYKKGECYYDASAPYSQWLFVACNVIFFIVANFVFWFNIMDVLYPIIAPRMYILEKVSSFIK